MSEEISGIERMEKFLVERLLQQGYHHVSAKYDNNDRVVLFRMDRFNLSRIRIKSDFQVYVENRMGSCWVPVMTAPLQKIRFMKSYTEPGDMDLDFCNLQEVNDKGTNDSFEKMYEHFTIIHNGPSDLGNGDLFFQPSEC
jgi:hypothetical protein